MRLTIAYLLVATTPMPLFAKDSAEESFWKWFKKNQEVIYHFERDSEAVFDRLAAAMHKVDKELTFEFSPIHENGKREFIISAGGIKASFPSVEALHAAAPKLPLWTILKYRQRRFPLNAITFADREVKPTDVHYAIFKEDDPKKVGIILFLDGYSNDDEDSTLAQMGYLFLDEALGEYDVETHVGAIVFSDRNSKHFKHARLLKELPRHFDEKLGRERRGKDEHDS